MAPTPVPTPPRTVPVDGMLHLLPLLSSDSLRVTLMLDAPPHDSAPAIIIDLPAGALSGIVARLQDGLLVNSKFVGAIFNVGLLQ